MEDAGRDEPRNTCFDLGDLSMRGEGGGWGEGGDGADLGLWRISRSRRRVAAGLAARRQAGRITLRSIGNCIEAVAGLVSGVELGAIAVTTKHPLAPAEMEI